MNIIKQTGTANTTASKGRKILYLAVHYTAGVSCKKGSASGCASWFANPNAGGSADYIVDEETFVQYNPDPKNRYCHAVGGGKYKTQGGRLYGVAKNANCISLEICSGNKAGKITVPNDPNYYFTDKVLEKAREAVQYLMQLYGIDADHVIRHYDVNGKPCPGVIGWNKDSGDESKWLAFHAAIGGKPIQWYRVGTAWENGACVGQIGAYQVKENAVKAAEQSALTMKVFDSTGNVIYTSAGRTTNGKTTAKAFAGKTEEQKAAMALELIRQVDTSGILYSVTAAQWILESGYCTTTLATEANNCFGMKTSLSGNTWESVWDGVSTFKKQTQEDDGHGNLYTIWADFRKYPCIEDSILDHAAYLLGAMDGSKKRFAGLTDCKDYKSAITLIKNGHYATDTRYVSKICNIIKRFGLDKYDHEIIAKRAGNGTVSVAASKVASSTKYRVQLGAFSGRAGAQALADKARKAGYNCFTEAGPRWIYVRCDELFDTEAEAKKYADQITTESGLATTVKEVTYYYSQIS